MNWKQVASEIPASVPLHGALALRTTLAVIAGVLVSVSTASAADVDAVRLWRAPDHIRVVLDLSDAAEFSTLSLDNPERFVVDLSQSRLKTSLSALPLEGTPISRVRSGIRQGTDLRLVFDLIASVRTSVFLLPPNDTTGHRVVIDLFDKTPTAEPKPVLSVESLEGRRDIVIAIDPGHGGEDPGALGPGGLREKTVVLQIARRLENQLAKIPGFKPMLVRTGDYYVSLKNRRDKARALEADLFVSIHADAFREKSAHGASVYALSMRGATPPRHNILPTARMRRIWSGEWNWQTWIPCWRGCWPICR